MPVLILTAPEAASWLFYVTLAAAVMLFIFGRRAPAQASHRRWFTLENALFALILLVPLSVIASQLHNDARIGSELERALRFALGLPILAAALRRLSRPSVRPFMASVYIAVLYGTALIVALIWPDWHERPLTADVGQYNTVTYSSLLLILTACSVYSLGVHLTSCFKTETVCKLLIALAGSAGFLLTQTRTGLLAMPLFVLLGLMLLGLRKIRFKYIAAVLLALALAGGLASQTTIVKTRVTMAAQEAEQCRHDNTSFSSVCIRLQLWHAAKDLWKRNFWWGTGNDRNFQKALQSYYLPRHEVSEGVARGWGEPHNDYLKVASSFGLIGLLAHLLVYGAPLYWFGRRLLISPHRQQQCFAAMGAAVCLGFMVSGLFETMFRDMKTMSFYVEMLAVFWVLSSTADNAEERF